jgi:hypothetical protein
MPSTFMQAARQVMQLAASQPLRLCREGFPEVYTYVRSPTTYMYGVRDTRGTRHGVEAP